MRRGCGLVFILSNQQSGNLDVESIRKINRFFKYGMNEQTGLTSDGH